MAETSRRLAEFVTSASIESFPPEAVETARRAVLDCIGVALAGSREPSTDPILELVEADGGVGPATVLGTGIRTTPSSAALANGMLAHILDFDDCSLSVDGHCSAVLVPAILALGESRGISGGQFLEAYIVGFEVMAAIGRSTARELSHRGWHATAVLGPFGAAAAAARMLALPAGEVETAFGVACSMAAGSRENFGTAAKALHCGQAARNGLLAAALAARGISATASAFEGRHGFFNLYAGEVPPADLRDCPGGAPDIVDSGIIFKAYPCCGNTHAAIDALGALTEEHGFSADEVAEIEVGVSCLVPGSLPFDNPSSPREARFSMPFCLAVRLLENSVALSHFSDSWIRSENVRALMGKVRMHVHPEQATTESLDAEFAEVTVRLAGGTQFSCRRRTSERTGSPANPLSWEQLVEKYTSCAKRVLNARAICESANMIGELDRLDDIGKLIATLSPGG